jgi:competence protein ComEC
MEPRHRSREPGPHLTSLPAQSAVRPPSTSAFRLAPVAAAALAFSSGIVFTSFGWRPPWLLLAALFTCAAATIVFLMRRPAIAYTLSLVAIAILGGFVLLASESLPPGDSSLANLANGSEITLTGHVVRDGVWRESPFGGREQSLDFEIELVERGDSPQTLTGAARLNIFSPHKSYRPPESDEADSTTADETPATPLYLYGQRLRLIGKLRRPSNYGNPGAFDYRGYLRDQGITATGSAHAETVELLPGTGGSAYGRLRSRIRRSVIAHIHRTWPAQQAALMDAMLIGERAFITRDIRDAFQRSGTYHILVVSGMNVGILAFIVFFVLQRIRMGAGIATVLTLLLSFGYAYLADLGAPIVRSVLMLAVYLIARLFYRDRAPLNAVGLAALAILVADPHSLFDPSFQLTFLSVFAIAGIGVPLMQRTSEPYRRALRMFDLVAYDLAHTPRITQFRLDLRLVASRLARFLGARLANFVVLGTCRSALALYELLLISALMQVSLALPMVWYFHRATVTALPANVLVVPLTGVLMPSSVAAVALSYISPWLAKVPAVIAALSLDAITGTVRLFGGIRIADVRVPVPSLLSACLAAAAFFSAVVLARRHRLLSAFGIILLVASAVAVAGFTFAPLRPHALEITAIDIGQGDSFLIITPDNRTILLDSGGHLGNGQSNFDVGEDVVSPYLWQRGISRLDIVAVSHAHSDHMGGMRAIVRNFHPRELWMGKSVSTSELESLRTTARENDCQLIERTAGEAFDFGGAHFDVLAPARDWELKSRVRDDDAMVLRVTYGATSMYLPGDSGKKVEEQLAPHLASVDLLKIAHHGSVTSTTPELLDALHPKFAVISVGAQNSFRHPRPEVLQRLQAAHVATYRTDTLGAVTFSMDGNSIRVVTPLR